MHLTSSGSGRWEFPPAPDLYRPRDHILFLDLDILFLEHVRVHVLGIKYTSDMYAYMF